MLMSWLKRYNCFTAQWPTHTWCYSKTSGLHHPPSSFWKGRWFDRTFHPSGLSIFYRIWLVSILFLPLISNAWFHMFVMLLWQYSKTKSCQTRGMFVWWLETHDTITTSFHSAGFLQEIASSVHSCQPPTRFERVSVNSVKIHFIGTRVSAFHYYLLLIYPEVVGCGLILLTKMGESISNWFLVPQQTVSLDLHCGGPSWQTKSWREKLQS